MDFMFMNSGIILYQFCPPPPPLLKPQVFKSSLNPHLSTPVYCDCPVTFPHKGQCPHTEQMREQEAELMLRSLYASTHPQGETVHCPDRLKLASSLQDLFCCLHLYSQFSRTLSPSVCVCVCVCRHIHHGLMT